MKRERLAVCVLVFSVLCTLGGFFAYVAPEEIAYVANDRRIVASIQKAGGFVWLGGWVVLLLAIAGLVLCRNNQKAT